MRTDEKKRQANNSVQPISKQAQHRRIAVALSGGVDSSVAAYLLKKEGHDVVGVTLKLQKSNGTKEDSSCCTNDSIQRARAAAEQLGIEHHVYDCAQEFDSKVLKPAWDEYNRGRTPSPCLMCNEQIKFGALLSWAHSNGASHLATGHYAQKSSSPTGSPLLIRGADKNKDQSYFLAGLKREQLESILFPIGHMTKPEIRAIARELGLNTADTSESQDACLVSGDLSFAEILRKRFDGETKPGPVLDESGSIVGSHEGIHHFTIGQRKGIHIQTTERCWVKSFNMENGGITVTWNEENLLGEGFIARGVNWIEDQQNSALRECTVQVRYRQKPVPAVVRFSEQNTLSVNLKKPVRAITPGQAAVFFDGARVLGRGWIYPPD